MTFNVLITSASRKVLLINAFKGAVEGIGKVHAGDINPYSPALYFADRYTIIPNDNDKNFRSWILDYCKNNNIKLLIPTRDEELPIFAGLANAFIAEGIRIMIASHETIDICQDKKHFIKFCNSHGFKTPDCYRSNDVRLKFPVFIKERIGKGGVNARRCNNYLDMDFMLGTMKSWDPIIQEFIDAPEYTVDILLDFDSNVISAIPRERITVIAGESQVSITRMNWKIINEAIDLAESLKLVGQSTMQCFDDDGEIKWIEVNPRFGGAANLGFSAGCNSPKLLVEMVQGKKTESRIGHFAPNLVMMRYAQDHIVLESQLATEPEVFGYDMEVMSRAF